MACPAAGVSGTNYISRLSRPAGRDKQFFTKNRPRDAQKHLSVLSYSLLIFLAVAHKLFQFVKEAFHVRKLAVDRGKADIGHLIDLFQFLHGQLADAHTGDLAVVGAEQSLLNAADSTFQRFVADRTLGTGAQHGVEQLLPVKGFAGVILFDDHQRHRFHYLVGGKAHVAVQALAAAADALVIFRGAGVDHLGFLRTAIRALHLLFLRLSSSFCCARSTAPMPRWKRTERCTHR